MKVEETKVMNRSQGLLRRFADRWLGKNSLGRNTVWMFMGHGTGILIKATYFVLIARFLGATQYGAFAGVVALIAILAPFSTLGSGSLLVKNVSRNHSLFREYWGNCLFMTLVSGSILMLLVLAIARLILPGRIPLLLVALVALSDLFLARAVDVCMQAFQAFEMVARMARVNIVGGSCRLLGAVGLGLFAHHPTALSWGAVYLCSSAIGAIVGVSWVSGALGTPALAVWRIRPELLEGCYWAVGLSAQSIYNDIDKTMLTRLSTLDAVGIYAAAYRLIDAAFIPLRSVLYAAFARFFKHGSSGVAGSTRYAYRLMPRTGGYGLLACVSLMVFAPVVPRFLGKEYATAVEAVRWLAPIVFFRSLHYFFGDSLSGAGHQGLRTIMHVWVAVLNVVLNLWLIPIYSWRGAAWASLASDGMLMVSMWLASTWLVWRETRQLVISTGDVRAGRGLNLGGSLGRSPGSTPYSVRE
jgi:O-antigen/teichoic acid export membrane protein